MKILIINGIVYTSETRKIEKVKTIKDSMIYDFCLAFHNKGNNVTLAAAADYKPITDEKYPFKIEWLKSKFKKICMPTVLPFCPGLKKLIKQGNFDLIITSDVFSLLSFTAAVTAKKKLIVWHELAVHQKLMHGIPSHVWYGAVAKIFFKNVLVVPRSEQAKAFISKYCNNVSDTIIDHGVNLEKFKYQAQKENCFVVCSRLVRLKKIDKIIKYFAEYLKKYDASAKLYIIGDGDKRDELIELTQKLKLEQSVSFTGMLSHSELCEYTKKAMAMLVYTQRDNNMISIVEALAVATPVITTSVPFNSSYIKKYDLGIVNDNWNEDDLRHIALNNDKYVQNCMSYRKTLPTEYKAEQFLNEAKKLKK